MANLDRRPITLGKAGTQHTHPAASIPRPVHPEPDGGHARTLIQQCRTGHSDPHPAVPSQRVRQGDFDAEVLPVGDEAVSVFPAVSQPG